MKTYVVDEQTIKEECLNCGSIDSIFDEPNGFYKCNVCQNVWAFDEDDPDYRELETCSNCGGSGYVEADYSYEPHEIRTICSFCDSEGVV